jgi:4-hydroxybenzoyl-CoA reductase subunit beta
LIALGAALEFLGPAGPRRILARDFYQGDGIARNVRKPGEILVRVTIPAKSRGLLASYEKLRLRGSFDFPECGIAVSLRMSGGLAREVTIVANALETTPVVLEEVARTLEGTDLSDTRLEAAARLVVESVQPVRNTAFPPAYRKKMAGVLAKRALRSLRSGLIVHP